MYHKKKIALFISHIYGEYQSNLCQGVIQQAAEYGYKVEVYATNDGEDLGEYSRGEAGICSIPNFSDIEGVLFASGTYADQKLRDKIYKLLKKQDCQVIDIDERTSCFPTVMLENNITTGTLTEHLISTHGLEDLCYLGSCTQPFYSDKRQKAFESVMVQHSLNVPKENIFLSDESDESFETALSRFTEKGTKKPQGIVCYNDDYAIRLWLEAKKQGYSIPEDFAIVGCDNTPAGQNLNPPLTTVSFPSYQLGCCAINALLASIQGKEIEQKTVFAEPVYAGSCGCNLQSSSSGYLYPHTLSKKISDLEGSMFVSMRMSAQFSHISDIDDGMDALEKYVKKIDNCSEFYLCLYSDWDKVQDKVLALTQSEDEEFVADDTILLKLAVKDGKRLPECTFSKHSLLPDYIDKESGLAYIISPLFFEDRLFGYIAISFSNNIIDYRFKLVEWIMNITQMLQNLCEIKLTDALKKELENLYLRDALTGLYNQHGFNNYTFDFQKKLGKDSHACAVLFDLDELKTINDNFGHEEGDFALKTIGHALLKAKNPDDLCCRFSGDEFYCLISCHNEEDAKSFIQRVNKYLSNYNNLSSKPYNISTSAGYALLDNAANIDMNRINELFSLADSRMYKEKKSKNKNVIRLLK